MNLTTRIIIAISALACFSATAFAMPASPVPFKAKTADGKEITVRLLGDENFHYYLNIDTNEKLLSRSDGLLFTATDAQIAALKDEGCVRRNAANKRRSMRAAKRRAGSSTTGDKRGLVILVNYTDVQMGSTHNQERWNRQFNEEGYGNNGHIGCVSEYFRDQSYGQLNIDFDVVGPYTLSKERAYYGTDEDAYGGGHDAHPCEMVAEACWLAADDVDFSNYDWDGDKEVDQVFVVYAGGGEHAGCGSDCIWPHEYALSSGGYCGDGDGALHIDGVRIDTYAVSCEKYLTTSSMDAIGAACHEFSHCLGLMDIYDTSYSGNSDMDDWDVLSSGSYNGSNFRGNTPCGYTAFERFYVGWMDIVDLTDTQQIDSMPALNDKPVAYAMTNPENGNEFFIMENRQAKRWFQYPNNAHGLLMYHIDWDDYAWWTNTMNSGDHSRVSIVPADGDASSNYQGDVFPGTKNVTRFDDKSHEKCGGKLYNKNTDGSYLLHRYLTNITETDSMISFKYVAPKTLSTPELSSPEVNEDGQYKFSWEKVDDADNYYLQIKRIAPFSADSDEPFITEDFNNLTTDGTTDVASVISSALNSDGWSGYHVFSSKKRVRIGTQVAEGYLQTPLLHTANGELTVKLTLKNIGTSENETLLQAIDADGVTISEMNISNDGTPYLYNLSVSGMSDGGDCYLRIYADTRVYLDDLTIFDGCWYDDGSIDDMNDICAEDDIWQWGDEKTFEVGSDKVDYLLDDVTILPGYGYYRCQLQAKAEDGTLSNFSNPVYIINPRPMEDGIRTIASDNAVDALFDLQGRRTTNPVKGIYIKNGSKYIVR